LVLLLQAGAPEKTGVEDRRARAAIKPPHHTDKYAGRSGRRRGTLKVMAAAGARCSADHPCSAGRALWQGCVTAPLRPHAHPQAA
jgi:hypothetical protein